MPTLTKTQIFSAVAADAKGQAVAPTEGSTEWNQWSSWLDEELYSLGEVSDWTEFKTTLTVSANQSDTSIALPTNFKKLAGHPSFNGNLANEVDYDQFQLHSDNALVCHPGYDNGWYLTFKPALAEDMNISIPLQTYPMSLVTPTSVINFRNPYYLVKRLKVRVFKKRQDPIFTEIEAEADTMLQQLLENENYKHAQYVHGASTPEERAGFVLGLD
jgi:hypothetical protein